MPGDTSALQLRKDISRSPLTYSIPNSMITDYRESEPRASSSVSRS